MKNLIMPVLETKDYTHIFENYIIEFCHADAVGELLRFIDEHWKKDHIFVLNRRLFDWQHFDSKNKRYNFVIARNKMNKEIDSILGFVPVQQFDENIQAAFVWPCLWKTKDNIHVHGLGTSLYHFLVHQIRIDAMAMIGLSAIANSIYVKWGFYSGKLNHYFLLNSSKNEFKLLGNFKYHDRLVSTEGRNTHFFNELVLCSGNKLNKVLEQFSQDIPRHKSMSYYINRFLKHPVYQYQAYLALMNKNAAGVFFTRVCFANGAKALRIVDFVGNPSNLYDMELAFQKLLLDLNCDYVDILNDGIDAEIFARNGFKEKGNGDLIIPNYFEPFVLENIELVYTFKSIVENEKAVIFKADADQDRPNL